MQLVASLERTTKRGLHSVWHFVSAPDGFYAFGGCHRPLVKRFESIEELRSLYRNYLGYGYSPVPTDVQLELTLA